MMLYQKQIFLFQNLLWMVCGGPKQATAFLAKMFSKRFRNKLKVWPAQMMEAMFSQPGSYMKVSVESNAVIMVNHIVSNCTVTLWLCSTILLLRHKVAFVGSFLKKQSIVICMELVSKSNPLIIKVSK